MTKEDMIQLLIKDDLNDWNDKKDLDAYIGEMLYCGFKGYSNMYESEIKQELIDRELLKKVAA
jgi:hypothetical protein